jgi:hypothetical protein
MGDFFATPEFQPSRVSAMHRFWCSFALVLLILVTVSCGGGSGRQLQSISINKTVVGARIQFVATGTFSGSPMTVTPLPVDWANGLLAPPPPQYTYTLSTQPHLVDCSNENQTAMSRVSAFAPRDANAPMSGTTKNVVTAAVGFSCQ